MLAIILLLLSSFTANAYIWPSAQLDALEALRFDQNGHNAGPIAGFIQPCNKFFLGGVNSTGRSNVGDWLRTAYHDMAAHNITDGTGGLDASIRFADEQIRDEVGCSVQVLRRYLLMTRSGGPEIAFRGGRVDAAEPNAPGVPQPQQDLPAHIAAFARQGFTQKEMISLVACGHTFGGVQHEFFPDIVPQLNDPNNTESVMHFDSTFVTFDNNLAREYVAGTTKDPLAVGFNHTTNSDKRIFGSDGNSTMRSFAESLEAFHSTCASVLARMFDTVPRGVQLTEIITPLPVKPHNIQLILDGDTLKLSGEVRFWNMPQDDNRKVLLLWDDHRGGTHNATLGFAGLSSAVAGKYTAAWYTFNTTAEEPFEELDPVAGITRMRFLVDGQMEDQGGVGFVVQDGVVFSNSSCATSQNPYSGRLDIAVRNGFNPARVYLERQATDDVQRPIVVETDVKPSTHTANATGPYAIWSIDLTDANKTVLYTIGFELADGKTYSTNDQHRLLDFPLCAT
ncbi:hypothetical protein CVT26_011276 [Gymnopilus dilepis]|uniref:Peroxidase n=1 Tax=Gymnopilus dilepis TaxID=231916 RepID=A0A409VJK6_9AGAR|nr:hypothetical protein CVT26_011276 [Gymnopilus dilepis]